MLRCEQLESRDAPAVSLGGGELLLSSGVQVHPFGDWYGDYNTLESGGLTYVGGTGGAGPRVAVLNPDGSRARGDYFAGPEFERFGVVFVGAGPAPEFQPTSIGEGFTLFVDADERATIDTAAVVRLAAERYFAPLLDVLRITNVRPDLTPGSYWTYILDASGGTWQGSGVVGRATLGSIPAPNPGFLPRLGVGRIADGTPVEFAAAVMAHEAGHGLGLSHRAGSIMAAPLDLSGRFTSDQLATGRAAALAGASTIQERIE